MSAGKIKMSAAITEIDGDEMARFLWDLIKRELILPFIELKTDYYDLSLKKREASKDEITLAASHSILKTGVGVKCATITANKARMAEYNLSALYPSPNATIRSVLDGTVFRKPILCRNIPPAIPTWKAPVIIARHAYGDVYKNVEVSVPEGSRASLVITDSGGGKKECLVAEFKDAGIVQAIHNLDSSITSFARCCFNFAREEKLPLWFCTKDTISKTYDGRFKEIFETLHQNEFKDVNYNYSLIDDAIAKAVRGGGGFLWALKNYDGDVLSDMCASVFGSLAMMSSVLVSPSGACEYEAAHGTVQRHYYRRQNGEITSTNPAALIFAWTGALAKRGALDGNAALSAFAEKLESAVLQTIEGGFMCGDLAGIAVPAPKKVLTSEEFVSAVKERIAD